MSVSSGSAPKGAGARKSSVRNSKVGINKGCRAIERKLASRVFKENQFFVQSYQKEGSAQSEAFLKNFSIHELKIKARRYSDANKNNRYKSWILFQNLTSLHPVLRK
ncbi:hypothetical protein GCM10011514_28080 [Emticicia aquatilis]|uniref:Uncharacterized protein n=1 Tax=Emticicia aquatilis TaxID=1537369 RepID=A0A916YVJ9_9BACT|nr:hypothetical protein GCM10011514_28080 [Emticicia aquatilis]